MSAADVIESQRSISNRFGIGVEVVDYDQRKPKVTFYPDFSIWIQSERVRQATARRTTCCVTHIFPDEVKVVT